MLLPIYSNLSLSLPLVSPYAERQPSNHEISTPGYHSKRQFKDPSSQVNAIHDQSYASSSGATTFTLYLFSNPPICASEFAPKATLTPSTALLWLASLVSLRIPLGLPLLPACRVFSFTKRSNSLCFAALFSSALLLLHVPGRQGCRHPSSGQPPPECFDPSSNTGPPCHACMHAVCPP